MRSNALGHMNEGVIIEPITSGLGKSKVQVEANRVDHVLVSHEFQSAATSLTCLGRRELDQGTAIATTLMFRRDRHELQVEEVPVSLQAYHCDQTIPGLEHP